MQPINQKDWDNCIKVLRILVDQPDAALDEMTLKSLVSKMYKQARKRKKQADYKRQKQADLLAKSETYIFQRNDETTNILPSEEPVQKQLEDKREQAEVLKFKTLHKSINCYVCKSSFVKLHHFYHLLCPKCAQFNYNKRKQHINLENRIALITGGRIKIGFELALMLLQDGARVIITTRFPENAALRYSQQPTYESWKDRLHIYGLDLRNIPQTEAFIDQLYSEYDQLDILINNAAQTIKRPLAFHQHLLAGEQKNYLLEAEKNTEGLVLSDQYFPEGKLDKDKRQIDLRPNNSWMTKLEKVSTLEMLEVQLVNTTAPFLLNSKLKALLQKSPHKRKFIVNVSAMEGKFNRSYKSVFHPHTNMAKAALNMMTRTSAKDYAEDGIYMTSVDTGWVTDENPHPKKSNLRENGFVTPLDSVDGAARVYHPIVEGLREEGKLFSGVFLKDYEVTEW